MKYSEKRKLGLVPLFHDPHARTYRDGAWPHWRGFTERQRLQAAVRESASNNGYHCGHWFPINPGFGELVK